MLQQNILEKEDRVYKKYLPLIKTIDNSKVPKINEWDIPYTINQLSYLTHSHYRYYGKFPSAVASQIFEQFSPPTPDHYVLDNFCGSGTTMVEAKLRGIKSFGIDISWMSVLASNVKTRFVSLSKTKILLNNLISEFDQNSLLQDFQYYSFLEKWFSLKNSQDLRKIQQWLIRTENSNERDFLMIAFLAIIRRVSKAFDGEVRPHINKNKKERDVLSAFAKKVNDMCKNHSEFMEKCPKKIESQAYVLNNLQLSEKFNDKKCYMVISHPPYLNSFNYTPVYNLEFYWSKPFETNFVESQDVNIYKNELKAHPANEKIQNSYFSHLKKCYEESYKIQPKNGYLAVVIGDCTRNKELVPVLDILTESLVEIGYKHIETNYRTTHYGLGKYAYNHRADYHEKDGGKRDGVLIFQK